MRKPFLLLVLLVLLSSLSYAAVAEYSFAQAPATYTELTAPTVIHSVNIDDAMSSVIDIGFNFAYSDGVYTHFKANSNGFITLNPTSTTSISNNLTTQLLIIAGVWDDLKTDATDASVSYELSGTAPNRVLTVQYKNLKWYYNASPVNLINFQIKLYETTNLVEIVYGTMGETPGTSASASAGMSGSIAGDFLSVTPASPATASFVTEFNTINGTHVPFMTGNKYIFTPPVANQPPNPALVIFPANNGWVFFDSVLSWRSGGGLPDSYNVYFGTDPNPPFIQNQATTTYAPILSMGTTYYWKIVPENSFGEAADCPVWTFRTPTMTQIAESFDLTAFPPAGWANPGTYTRSTTTPYHGTGTAYKSAPVTPALLSTPLVSIEANSALNFWARTSATTGNGRIQIQYSPDRITWTNIGDVISLPTATTWNNYNVDLSSLAGNNYYLAFASSSVTSTTAIYIDLVFGPEIVPVVPEAVTLVTPADAAQNVLENVTLNWTPASTGGVPTGYRVYLDNNPDPQTLATTTSSLLYTPDDPLEYGATYYWKVIAFNAAGDAPASAVRSFTVRPNPVVSTFPYNVDFGTTTTDPFPPVNWSKHSGILAEPTVLGAAGTGSWYMDDWANITTPPNKAGKINIYSTLNGWLITPPLNLPGTDYQLEVDIALTDYASTNPITSDPNGTTGVDDRFIILIGDGTSWSPANILREYNNTGSP
ncbi:MAG TPA: choice-of-anchor J domain-containing protein, partial [Candidatus Cloacimonadota bacterium]|nr:choice-of-anchor J domain-containing protein [Candidatus Cloacimonadota bacterium]